MRDLPKDIHGLRAIIANDLLPLLDKLEARPDTPNADNIPSDLYGHVMEAMDRLAQLLIGDRWREYYYGGPEADDSDVEAWGNGQLNALVETAWADAARG